MKLTALLISLMCFINTSTAQPKFMLQLYGGYSIPVGQLRGTLPATITTDDMRYRVTFPGHDSNSYYTKHGYIMGAAAKLTASSRGYIRLVFNTLYKHFSSSQKSSLINNNSTFANVTFESLMTIFTLGIGAEYAFTPAMNMNPYVSSDIKVNFISGSTHVNFYYPVTGSTYDSNYTLNSTVRLGMGITAGVEVRILKNMGLVSGIRYGIENLLRTATDTTKLIGTTQDRSYDLNDKEYTYKNQRWPVKLIGDIQFLAGVSYYFGSFPVKKKK
jgi:opacity protein-like surface antigen